jgi:Tol biopolymer transport system component/DNA-binding winged helix-turn-helix (wHTH) protein
MANDNRAPLRLGEWTVFPDRNEVANDETRICLEPKAMQTLLKLCERPQGVWSRQELLEAVWPETVVGDEVLTRVISILRQTFGDSSREPKYIATIYKKGYRLVAPVEPCEEKEEPVLADGLPDRPVASTAAASHRTRNGVVAAVLVAVAASLVAIPALRQNPEPVALNPSYDIRPATSLNGFEIDPALSPDGTMLAFGWRQDESSQPSIWVKNMVTDSLLQVTHDAGASQLPCWSPDGERLAYLHAYVQQALRIVNRDGSGGRVLAVLPLRVNGFDWSLDGNTIAIAGQTAQNDGSIITLLNVNDGATRPLLATTGSGQQRFPHFSPDGKKIAFADYTISGEINLEISSLDGKTQTICSLANGCGGLDWLSDGEHIVVSFAREELYELHLIRIADGSRTRINSESANAYSPTVARAAQRVAFVDSHRDVDIWTKDLANNGVARRLISSTTMEARPRLSPDGKTLAFLADRTGHTEIWLGNVDGSHVRRLTSFDGPWLSRLAWHPDGGELLVSRIRSSNQGTYLVDTNTGTAQSMGSMDGDMIHRGWSRDGRWLYLSKPADDNRNAIWRMKRDGTETELLLPRSARFIGETGIGHQLLFVKQDTDGIWFHDLETGEEGIAVDPIVSVAWFGRSATDNGFCFQTITENRTVIGHYDLSTAEIDTLALLDSMSMIDYSVSPDHQTLFFSLNEQLGQDIGLIADLVIPEP